MLLGVTCVAICVHGYHPNAEDAEIYLPGVEKYLQPGLFPYNQQFFESHARFTVFPQLVAAAVRVSHLPFYWTLLLLHFIAIGLLLFACYRLSALCTDSIAARWAAVGLVAALLTLPVAGTALYLMDQYVNPRNLAAFSGVLAISLLLEERYVPAAICLALGFTIHPFMSFFALAFCGICVLIKLMTSRSAILSATCLLPLGFLYPSPSPAYHQVALSHPYHYLLRWHWYEWLGAFGPLVIFWFFARLAHSQKRPHIRVLCWAAIVLGSGSLLAALVLSIPQRFEVLARVQPLRSFYLLYILLLILSGIFAGEYILKDKAWRWFALFTPMCIGMFLAQRDLFPQSAHIEWPGAPSHNAWMQAFEWIRDNTSRDAIFALDPYHMRIAGEDALGFRAAAKRSMLADAVKDSGAVSMFPPLADEWLRQVEAQRNWQRFTVDDFRRLNGEFGVSWVVLEQPEHFGFDCPYQNRAVLVCRLNFSDSALQQSRR